ncbi:MAG TPA: sigma factor, partial [Acidimicrobiales bacterium]|nr:sigma factor [Acidimicrobiales bacterium]
MTDGTESSTTEWAEDRLEPFRAFARSGEGRLRDELVESHLGLAKHLARRFLHRGQPYEDLVQV